MGRRESQFADTIRNNSRAESMGVPMPPRLPYKPHDRCRRDIEDQHEKEPSKHTKPFVAAWRRRTGRCFLAGLPRFRGGRGCVWGIGAHGSHTFCLRSFVVMASSEYSSTHICFAGRQFWGCTRGIELAGRRRRLLSCALSATVFTFPCRSVVNPTCRTRCPSGARSLVSPTKFR